MHGTDLCKVVTSTVDSHTHKFDVHRPTGPAGYGLTIDAQAFIDLRGTPAGESTTLRSLERQVAADFIRYVDEVLPAIAKAAKDEAAGA